MGAGCCRARVFPGPGPGPGMHGGSASIADLRPGSKFHFNRELFLRQHLVIADKPLRPRSLHGLHNPAFSTDADAALRTLQGAPAPAPVPPPRKKRRPRPANAPPLPPARASRAARRSDSSILSPTHTMELLQHMSRQDLQRVQVEAARRARRARQSPDRKDSSVSLPAETPSDPVVEENRLSQQTFSTASSRRSGGSWEVDLSKAGTPDDDNDAALFASARRQVDEERAYFSLQSWDERSRRLQGDDSEGGLSLSPVHARSSSTPVPNSALLLSPRQWRPARPASLEPDVSARQTATKRAMSDFILDTYGAHQLHRASPPPGEEAAGGSATESEKNETAPAREAEDGEDKSLHSQEGDTSQTLPADAANQQPELNNQSSDEPTRRRSTSAASSLGDLEEDIFRMLSSSIEQEEDSLSSADLVLRQQKQYLQRLGEHLVTPKHDSSHT